MQEKGTVNRGWLGVAIQPVTPEVAESLGLSKAGGALVAAVTADSPAAKAGLRQGDVITAFDGKPIATPRELSRAVADAEIGEKGKLQVWRDSREIEVGVHIGEMPKQVASNAPSSQVSRRRSATKGGVELGALGLTLAPLDDGNRARWGLAEKITGALVASVERKATPPRKVLQPGDVITRINQETVRAPPDVAEAVRESQIGPPQNGAAAGRSARYPAIRRRRADPRLSRATELTAVVPLPPSNPGRRHNEADPSAGSASQGPRSSAPGNGAFTSRDEMPFQVYRFRMRILRY